MMKLVPHFTIHPISALTLLAVVSAGAGPATAPAADTALDAAKAYTAHFTNGEPLKAVEETWDMDAMIDGIFGDAMSKVSDTDRKGMQDDLLGFIKKVFSNPQVAKAMKEATYTNFKAGDEKDGKVEVTFDLVFNGKTIPNSLIFHKKDSAWKIMDAGNKGHMMCDGIKQQFTQHGDGMTPPQFIKEMSKAM